MAPTATDLEPVACSDCGDVSLRSVGDVSPCCDATLRPIDVDQVTVEPPSLEAILGVVFGMTRTELDVCLCVMEVGQATANEIATDVGVDRSHVSRHLNHLVDLGVLEREQRLLERGGRVNVYSPAALETVRQRFVIGLFAWVADAVEEVEGISREKVEAITQLTDDAAESTIYFDDPT